MIPAIILSFGMMVFSESLRYLLDCGQSTTHLIIFARFTCSEDEALQVLADLYGGGDKLNELVVLEYEEIRQQVKFSATDRNLN